MNDLRGLAQSGQMGHLSFPQETLLGGQDAFFCSLLKPVLR